MAAISGLFCFDGAPAAALCGRVAARMTHRSPDGIHVWDGAHVALASGALHANAEAGFNVQPLHLADGSVFVADGWVQDRPGLCHALGLSPATVATLSDAALLARAWLRWREDLWQYVTAEYALAVWEPATARLSIVRDRVGMRPVYVAQTSKFVAFASEPEALLGLPGVASNANMERVASNLTLTFDDADRGATLYRDVRRVQSGEIMEVGSSGHMATRPYFHFAPRDTLRLSSHGEYVEAFRATFDAAVAASVRGTTKPALMLSGGMDSAAVHASALAQGLPLRRIAVLADQAGAEEERVNIEAMLALSPDKCRIEVPAVAADPTFDLAVLVARAFNHAHPVVNSILLPLMVNQVAASSGSRVMLDGIDGDLVMSAPDNYVGRLVLAGRLQAAWREAHAAARHHTYLKHLPAWKILGWSVASRMEPGWLARWRYRLADQRDGDRPYRGMLHPDLIHGLRLRERNLESRMALRGDSGLRDWSGYRAWMWANPGFMRGGEGFDLAAARCGIETRHPWCDPRVIDLFLQLPMDVVVRNGWTKHVARTAYEPELGAVAWHSGKRHFGPQVTRLMLNAGKEEVERALATADEVLAGVVDPDAIAAARTAWAKGPDDTSANDSILDIVTLVYWFQRMARESNEGSLGLSPDPDPPDL